LSTQPSVDKAFGGTYALIQVKDGKIVKRNTLMVRMQVLSGEDEQVASNWCKKKIVFACPLLPFGTVWGSPHTLHTFANRTG
ncbi:MAG: hypothetical protein WDZ47_14010, partial [Bacteroidales bacterium]